MTRYVLMTMLLTLPVAAAPAERPLVFTKLWTHGQTTPGQVPEILAFDRIAASRKVRPRTGVPQQ